MSSSSGSASRGFPSSRTSPISSSQTSYPQSLLSSPTPLSSPVTPPVLETSVVTDMSHDDFDAVDASHNTEPISVVSVTKDIPIVHDIETVVFASPSEPNSSADHDVTPTPSQTITVPTTTCEHFVPTSVASSSNKHQPLQIPWAKIAKLPPLVSVTQIPQLLKLNNLCQLNVISVSEAKLE